MFSYNWDHQPLVLEAVAFLKSKGVDVWVDVQGSSCLGKMAGSTDEMMIKVSSCNGVCTTLPLAYDYLFFFLRYVGCNASSLVSLQAVNLSSHVVVFVSQKYLVSANCNQEVMRGPSLLAVEPHRRFVCVCLFACVKMSRGFIFDPKLDAVTRFCSSDTPGRWKRQAK